MKYWDKNKKTNHIIKMKHQSAYEQVEYKREREDNTDDNYINGSKLHRERYNYERTNN